MAYNASAASDAMRRIAVALDASDAPAAMYDLITSLGGPTSLAALGFPTDAIQRAAELAAAAPYPNPRQVTTVGVAGLPVFLRAREGGARMETRTDGAGNYLFERVPDGGL